VPKPPTAAELVDAILTLLGQTEPAALDESDAQEYPSPGLRILLAEDGVVNQEVASGLLELSGHTVSIANNGREAVEAYERGEFDAVLMDLEMPEMDGLEATRRIREVEIIAGRHTPIVAMTAHAVQGFRESCLAAGMDDYITKPIDLNDLTRVLAAISKRAPMPPVRA
jgi:CheY-like chemotaxis protein